MLWEIKKFLKVFDIEILRILLFVIKVLLVEGVIDREVVEGIFIYIKCEDLEEKIVDVFNKDIIIYQVIFVYGCENIKKVKLFCFYINLKCLCLWDFDKVVNFEKKICVIKEFLEIDKVFEYIYNNKYCDEKFLLFIDNEDFLNIVKLLEFKNNMFIWRYGVIEDVILSFINCNEEICKFFNCKKKFDFIVFKNKLKE